MSPVCARSRAAVLTAIYSIMVSKIYNRKHNCLRTCTHRWHMNDCSIVWGTHCVCMQFPSPSDYLHLANLHLWPLPLSLYDRTVMQEGKEPEEDRTDFLWILPDYLWLTRSLNSCIIGLGQKVALRKLMQ